MIKRVKDKHGFISYEDDSGKIYKRSEYFKQFRGDTIPVPKKDLTSDERRSIKALSRLRMDGKFIDKIRERKTKEYLERIGYDDELVSNDIVKSFGKDVADKIINEQFAYYMNTNSKTSFNVTDLVARRVAQGYDFTFKDKKGKVYKGRDAIEKLEQTKSKKQMREIEKTGKPGVVLYQVREQGDTIEIDDSDSEVISSNGED